MRRLSWMIGVALIGAYFGSKNFHSGWELAWRVVLGIAIGALLGAAFGLIFSLRLDESVKKLVLWIGTFAAIGVVFGYSQTAYIVRSCLVFVPLGIVLWAVQHLVNRRKVASNRVV